MDGTNIKHFQVRRGIAKNPWSAIGYAGTGAIGEISLSDSLGICLAVTRGSQFGPKVVCDDFLTGLTPGGASLAAKIRAVGNLYHLEIDSSIMSPC